MSEINKSERNRKNEIAADIIIDHTHVHGNLYYMGRIVDAVVYRDDIHSNPDRTLCTSKYKFTVNTQ